MTPVCTSIFSSSISSISFGSFVASTSSDVGAGGGLAPQRAKSNSA